MAGKQADLHLVTLKKIEASHLPGTQRAAGQVAQASLTPRSKALRAGIKSNLEREVKFRLLARNKQAVMDALVAKAGTRSAQFQRAG